MPTAAHLLLCRLCVCVCVSRRHCELLPIKPIERTDYNTDYTTNDTADDTADTVGTVLEIPLESTRLNGNATTYLLYNWVSEYYHRAAMISVGHTPHVRSYQLGGGKNLNKSLWVKLFSPCQLSWFPYRQDMDKKNTWSEKEATSMAIGFHYLPSAGVDWGSNLLPERRCTAKLSASSTLNDVSSSSLLDPSGCASNCCLSITALAIESNLT